MRCLLVVPDLVAAAAAQPALARVLSRLAAFGGTDDVGGDLDAVTTAQVGVDVDGSAPLAALGAGVAHPAGYLLRADPVSLVAGRDDVLLAGRIDDLAAEEATALRDTLAAHFAADGLTFLTPRPDAWFVHAVHDVPVTTTSLAAVTGPLHGHLPEGPHGRTWRRWISEMQMLLHSHAVNAQREARGLAPVTGIWISAGGTLLADARPRVDAVFATAGRAGDVARGLAALAQAPVHALPASFAALPMSIVSLTPRTDGPAPAPTALLALPPPRDAHVLAQLERDWLTPAVDALVRGTLDELVVLGDGTGHARRWQARTPTLLARLRARFART